MTARASLHFRKESLSGSLTLQVGSMQELRMGDGVLDGVITVNTIYFVPDLERACAELARVLGPAGRAVVGLADPAVMAKMPFASHGFILRPVGDVVNALARAALTAVERIRLGDGEGAYHLLVATRGQAGESPIS